jgi:hypothetical protein
MTKYKIQDVQVRFATTLRSLTHHHRVKFVLYRTGKQPVKGSGFLTGLEKGHEQSNDRLLVLVEFGHLKFRGPGTQNKFYSSRGAVALKNIRFVVSSLGQYYSMIMDDHVLHDFFQNHLDTRNEKSVQKSLTKFDIAALS